MPIPTPRAGESQDDFLGRCHSELSGEFPDADQRNAVCMQSWHESMSVVELVVVPDGYTQTVDGREFTLTIESAQQIIKAFVDRGIDMVVDYEHQTLGGKFASPDGKAPAAGWIKALSYEVGKGIVAQVEWTAEARDRIRKKEYRYLSPVMRVSKDDREVTQLDSVAVTNDPAIPNIEPIAARVDRDYILVAAKAVDVSYRRMPMANKKTSAAKRALELMACTTLGDDVSALTPEQEAKIGATTDALEALKKIVADAGVKAETMTLDELLAKVGEIVKGSQTYPLEKVAARLGLAKDATDAMVCEKLDAMNVELVSVDAYKKVADRLASLEALEVQRNAKSKVDEYVACGKLNPNFKDQIAWAMTAAVENVEGFDKLMANAPKHWPAGRAISGGSLDSAKTKRQSTIEAAKKEYADNSEKLQGVEMWAFVNASLGTEGHDTLSKEERKTLATA